MRYEESFIIIKFIWHDYLIPNLGMCVYETSSVTSLSSVALQEQQKWNGCGRDDDLICPLGSRC